MLIWTKTREWAARGLIGFVLFVNVQCAVLFLASPGSFSNGFELSGEVGDGIVRGLGVLFLMWSVPYWVAFINPIRWKTSLYEAVAMQVIGFFGEAIVLAAFSPGHPIIQTTINRFLLFDGLGLVCLVLSTIILRRSELPG